MVAIDTNVAIAHFRGQLSLPAGVGKEDFVLPVVVAGELLFGARNSGQPGRNLAHYRSFIYDLDMLLLDALAAEHYAEIRLHLKQRGRPIPENDRWIAAICRANEVPLFTLDRHFSEVPSLQLVGA